MTLNDRILKIQNGRESLRWGCTRHSEKEILYAVGHKSYPNRVCFFVVSESLEVCLIGVHDQLVLEEQCKTEKEVIKCIVRLLKEWFPAKGV